MLALCTGFMRVVSPGEAGGPLLEPLSSRTMSDVVFEKVDYKGGFEGMVATDKATLTLSEDRFTLRRPRRFGRTLLKVWARWTAVKEFNVSDADDGTKIEITTGKLGPAVVVIHGAEPIDVYRQISTIAGCHAHIPSEIRSELGLPSESDTTEAIEETQE